jgi:alpha-beta hydrolase superfamily lysophospholipase
MLGSGVEDWVKDVEERAVAIRQATGRLPILHGHSTGALVALVAVARFGQARPGEELCNGLILSAPPFELRQTAHRMGLIVARVMRRFSAGADFWRRFGASMDGGGLDPDIPGKEAPTARWLPVQMLLELEKLRPLAANLTKALHVPVLVLHGTNDVMANWKATAAAFRRIASPDRDLVILREGRHSMMFGPHADEFETTIEQWIRSHQESFDKGDERSVRAHMLRCLHDRWAIPEEPRFTPLPAEVTRRGWLFRWR